MCLIVFARPVSNFLPGIEFPVSFAGQLSVCRYRDNVRRLNRRYVLKGSDCGSWTKTHRTRDVFLFELPRVTEQRCCLGGPDDSRIIKVIVERARSRCIPHEIENS